MGVGAINCRIQVFAKSPVAGQAKTRLIPALGAEGAAQLQRWLIERALLTAVAAGVGPVELWCAPDCRHPFLRASALQYGIELHQQRDGDLGQRMRDALEAALAGAAAVLLIGCDCPPLTPDYLRRAAAALALGCDAVFGPAEDGGYGLVGIARRAPDEIFEDIPWGTPGVMRETRLRLASAAWHWREMPQIWDVDRPEDLPRLRQYQDQIERNGQSSRRLPTTLPSREEEEETPRNR